MFEDFYVVGAVLKQKLTENAKRCKIEGSAKWLYRTVEVSILPPKLSFPQK